MVSSYNRQHPLEYDKEGQRYDPLERHLDRYTQLLTGNLDVTPPLVQDLPLSIAILKSYAEKTFGNGSGRSYYCDEVRRTYRDTEIIKDPVSYTKAIEQMKRLFERDFVGAELEKMSKEGLELSNGNTVPLVFFPKDLRSDVRQIIALSPSAIMQPTEETAFSLQWEKDRGQLQYVTNEHINLITDRLQPLVGVHLSGSRAVMFGHPKGLIESIRASSQNGGASRDPEGTCIDGGGHRWPTKFLTEYDNQDQPGVVFLYDLDVLERVPESVRESNVVSKYHGYRPKEGNQFVDALRGVIAFG